VQIYLIVGTDEGLNSVIRPGSIGTQTRPKTCSNLFIVIYLFMYLFYSSIQKSSKSFRFKWI